MQGSSKLTLLIRHLRTPGEAHDLSLVVLDRLQHMAGVGFFIFENTKINLPHLEGVWLRTIRDYLQSIQGSLQITHVKLQPLQRVDDRYIMDLVLAAGFKKTEIQRINYRRLYLQVLTISDMCNATGDQLAMGIYEGVKSSQQSISLLEEPLQERPGNYTWTIWRRFLKTLARDRRHLNNPLGPWDPIYPTRRNWPNYYSPSREFLYRAVRQKYTVHRWIRPTVYSFFEVDIDSDLPDDIIPVDIQDIADGWQISNVRFRYPIPPVPEPVQTFQEYVESRPDYESLLLLRHELLGGDIFDIGKHLKNLDNIILVSDGGALAQYGSYGWVLGTKDGKRLAQGSGAAFGFDPRSYRAEGYGAKAGTLFILLALKYCLAFIFHVARSL